MQTNNMIHEYGKCEVTVSIIDGTFNYETLQDLLNQTELELFMKALIRCWYDFRQNVANQSTIV